MSWFQRFAKVSVDDPKLMHVCLHGIILSLTSTIMFCDVSGVGTFLPSWLSSCPFWSYYVFASILILLAMVVVLIVLAVKGCFREGGALHVPKVMGTTNPYTASVQKDDYDWRFGETCGQNGFVRITTYGTFFVSGLLAIRLAMVLLVISYLVVELIVRDLKNVFAYQGLSQVETPGVSKTSRSPSHSQLSVQPDL